MEDGYVFARVFAGFCKTYRADFNKMWEKDVKKELITFARELG